MRDYDLECEVEDEEEGGRAGGLKKIKINE